MKIHWRGLYLYIGKDGFCLALGEEPCDFEIHFYLTFLWKSLDWETKATLRR